MSGSYNINFFWPFMIGMSALLVAGIFKVLAIIGIFDSSFSLKGGFFMIIMALVLGGIGWLFIKIAQANQETDEESGK